VRLILVSFPLAIGLGYLLGGRLRNLGGVRLRFLWIGLAAVGLQLLPGDGVLGSALLLTSFALLLAVGLANRRVPGFGLVVAGLCLNFLVIAVNDGMPVTTEAVVASGQADTLDDLRARGAKHHLATPEDDLLVLADRFGIPTPVRQVVSVGDVLAYAGAMWFVVAGMRRRAPQPVAPRPAAEAVG
jgi:Family of unknown function (DUF5317)